MPARLVMEVAEINLKLKRKRRISRFACHKSSVFACHEVFRFAADKDHNRFTCIRIGPSARPWMNWSTYGFPDRSISATGPCQMIFPS